MLAPTARGGGAVNVAGDRDSACLILCEHPPLITVGRQGSRGHIRFDTEELFVRGWPVRWVNRGGGCLLHLPGQLAIYPILPLARLAVQVVGVEGDAALVARARGNARHNGLRNAEFHVADLSAPPDAPLPWMRHSYSHVLLDPPRTGARAVLAALAQIAPQHLLYISCHPGSLARDLGVLVHEHGFALAAAGVVDMFPHTAHVESLALLTAGTGSGAAAPLA